jgi:hypothetical protein
MDELNRVGDFRVKRTSYRLFHRWSWIVLTKIGDPVEFEGGWAHTRWGAERVVRRVPLTVRL